MRVVGYVWHGLAVWCKTYSSIKASFFRTKFRIARKDPNNYLFPASKSRCCSTLVSQTPLSSFPFYGFLLLLNAPKHEVKSQRRPPYKICPKPPTVKIQQISSQVSAAKQSCTPQKTLTLKRIRLLSPQKYSPASILKRQYSFTKTWKRKHFYFQRFQNSNSESRRKKTCIGFSFIGANGKSKQIFIRHYFSSFPWEFHIEISRYMSISMERVVKFIW